MNSKPDHTEASSSKQANPLKILRKPFPKLVVLVSGKVGPDVKITLIPIAVVDLDSLFLVTLGLANIIISFLEATQFFLGLRIILFSSIK